MLAKKPALSLQISVLISMVFFVCSYQGGQQEYVFVLFITVVVSRVHIFRFWVCFSFKVAILEIHEHFKFMDFFCYGRSKGVKYATDLADLLEATSTTHPPRPEEVTFYGKPVVTCIYIVNDS